jgi:hypothetical protein
MDVIYEKAFHLRTFQWDSLAFWMNFPLFRPFFLKNVLNLVYSTFLKINVGHVPSETNGQSNYECSLTKA